MSSAVMYIIKGSKIAVPQFFCASRHYSKNVLRRNPIRVITAPSENSVEPIRDEGFSSRGQLNTVSAQNEMYINDQARVGQIMIPPYDKLQKNDARFTKILGIMKNRKQREKSGKIMLEGKRLINDAIEAGMVLNKLFFSRDKDLADIKCQNLANVEICKVIYKTLKVWSDLTTCPGVVGIFKKPTVDDLHICTDPTIPVTVICDNIRDPGNLGSIIRNAAAAGCEHILLTKGCVDPWETKVLRAGCGGHFRIPIVNDIEWTHLSNYLSRNSSIFVADNTADIEEHSYTSEYINYDEGPDNNEDVKYRSFNEHDQAVVIDESYNETSELEKFQEVPLPCHLYTSIMYPKKDIVLCVGGETHGIDPRVVKLACDYGGKKIKIPLENGMESLNSSFAMTIILYEIKKQFKEIYVTK